MSRQEFNNLKIGDLIEAPDGIFTIEHVYLGVAASAAGGPVYRVRSRSSPRTALLPVHCADFKRIA
jgi:hypothetical protein